MRASHIRPVVIALMTIVAATSMSVPLGAGSPPSEVRESREARPRIVVEWDPTYTFGLGFGGAGGMDWKEYSFGFAGFVTPLNPTFRDIFLRGAGNAEVPLNWGAEIFADRYFQPDRKGFGLGLMVGFDQFQLRSANEVANLNAIYVVPRIKYRLYLVEDIFYFEPKLGAALRVWDNGPVTLDDQDIRTGPIAPLMFLTLGVSIPL